ncbi:MAG: hypothetical protein KDL87_13320, partial [Verrucomicrobiae bacterium]|nr:hypothetical protein [Verrucomicrobiae bacterium]
MKPVTASLRLGAILAAAGWSATGTAQQAPPPTPAPAEVTTAAAPKRAKQIRVFADEPNVKSAFINFSDGITTEFSTIFGENDEAWVFPIELRITGSPNDVVTGRTAVIPPIELLPTGIFQLQLAVRFHNRY